MLTYGVLRGVCVGGSGVRHTVDWSTWSFQAGACNASLFDVWLRKGTAWLVVDTWDCFHDNAVVVFEGCFRFFECNLTIFLIGADLCLTFFMALSAT